MATIQNFEVMFGQFASTHVNYAQKWTATF